MAWAQVRVSSDGQRRHIGYYRDPTGSTRSAGTFSNERAAQRAEGKVEDGRWYDRYADRVTFATTSSRPGGPAGTWKSARRERQAQQVSGRPRAARPGAPWRPRRGERRGGRRP